MRIRWGLFCAIGIARALEIGLLQSRIAKAQFEEAMSALLIFPGLAMLILGGFLLKFGMPKNGQVRPFLAAEYSQILYIFIIMICIISGIGLLMGAVSQLVA
jgi:hypothetical protein